MAKIKKKIKKAVTKKPAWVGEVDLSACEFGLVYNIYQCRKCLLEYKEDHARKKRLKALLLPGNKKKQIVVVCKCDDPTPLLIKYKKCPCRAEYWGFYLRENSTCKVCGAFDLNAKSKERDYYRLNEFYKQSSEDLSNSNHWDCINRNLCLEVTFKDGSKKGIACLNCPFYEKGKMI